MGEQLEAPDAPPASPHPYCNAHCCVAQRLRIICTCLGVTAAVDFYSTVSYDISVAQRLSRRVCLVRLSSASFVSCAAAVGGEKTAASTPLAGSRSSKGRAKKAGVLSGNVGSAAGATTHEKGSKDVRPGGGDDAAEPLSGVTPPRPPSSCSEETSAMGVDAVAGELSRRARVPSRRASAPLYFAFDHCFSVRGQGTILTGTVLTGEVKVRVLRSWP